MQFQSACNAVPICLPCRSAMKLLPTLPFITLPLQCLLCRSQLPAIPFLTACSYLPSVPVPICLQCLSKFLPCRSTMPFLPTCRTIPICLACCFYLFNVPFYMSSLPFQNAFHAVHNCLVCPSSLPDLPFLHA